MANDVILGMGFHHISLKVTDYDRSVRFYRELGLKQIVEWGEGESRISMHDLGDGTRIEIFASKGEDYPPEGRWQHFALAVRDVDAAYNHALSVGAKSRQAPALMKIPDARPCRMNIYIAFVEGPDGEVIEFFKQVVQMVD